MTTFLVKIVSPPDVHYRLVLAADATEANSKALDYAISIWGGLVSVDVLETIS